MSLDDKYQNHSCVWYLECESVDYKDYLSNFSGMAWVTNILGGTDILRKSKYQFPLGSLVNQRLFSIISVKIICMYDI